MLRDSHSAQDFPVCPKDKGLEMNLPHTLFMYMCVLYKTITVFILYLWQNVAGINQGEDTENQPAISIDSNFQDIKVVDTSEHKITSSTRNRIR